MHTLHWLVCNLNRNSNQHVQNLAFESTVVPTCKCVRSLLFFTLVFNGSYYHIRNEVCEISLVSREVHH